MQLYERILGVTYSALLSLPKVWPPPPSQLMLQVDNIL